MIGYGGTPKDLKDQASERLRLGRPAVSASVDGVPLVFDSDEWNTWAVP